MEKAKRTLCFWNQKINGIWEEEPEEAAKAEERSRRERAAAYCREHRYDFGFVLLMGCLLFALAWILPFNEAPDEEMRYMIPQYIYRYGTLPAGYDAEVRNAIWGISYAYHPILPYIFGGYLMKLVAVFNDSDHALLMAARFINVLIGMGFYWYVLQIARKLFHSRLFRSFFIALLALLPQLLYLFVYVNTDAIAVFSSAIIIYYWLRGLETRWNRGACTGLAVGVSVCALSYFNAYGYALFSIILFVGTMIVFYRRKGAAFCTQAILKRGIFIAVVVFLLCGWWFIRCGILYDGDFLGLSVGDKYAEQYAAEDYKPSVRESLAEQGVPLDEMLTGPEDGMDWLTSTYQSLIGCFGYMKYYMGLDIYEIHKRLFGLGMLGIGLHCLLFVRRLRDTGRGKGRETLIPGYRNCEMCPANFCILQVSLGCCIAIPILLSVYYSYCSDFQPQGRYIMPMIIPVMYFTASGVQRAYTLVFRKWLVPLMMIPLFYAVLHVFLAAFVSVYVPTYVGALASWADIRFPWFANVGILARILQMVIPG